MSESQQSRRTPMRIATVLSCPVLPGAGLGSFLIGLNERLQQRPDFELKVVAPAVERGAAGRRGAQALLAAEQLRELSAVRPDVVHVHDHPALLASAVAYRLLVNRRTRVVFSSHLDLVEPRARWKRKLMGRLVAHCAAVTVVCRDSVRKLTFMTDPVPSSEIVRIVPGAASVRVREKHDPDVRAYAASIGHTGGSVILQVSNFTYPAKVAGTLQLIRAMVQVRHRCPDARLIVLGRGPLISQALATRDELGLSQAVTIPGVFVEDLSLPAALTDVHCHITGQDACPISILEAMHAAKPIVASRTGGIPEILEHGVTGVLVGNHPEEIATAILTLLEDRALAQRIGQHAMEVARTRYTWDRVAADVEAIYRATPQVQEPVGEAVSVGP